jgi:hypothetical protein
MHLDRLDSYQKIEELFDAKLITFVTGDRKGLETQVHKEVLGFMVHHLDVIGKCPRIVLYLHSLGGDTIAGFSIVNLLRQFCDEFIVIVPYKALSAATLISLGADKVIMTKQACLGPIDPSVNGPLNPQIPGHPPNMRAPVSVEAVSGFFDFARENGGEKALDDAFKHLCDHVHPLVIGQVFRARTQIRMLAEGFLKTHLDSPTQERIEKILKFLCSESGSHDYTINRIEAAERLELSIQKPDDEQYQHIWHAFQDIQQDLELNSPYDPQIVIGASNNISYSLRRGIIESVDGGCHYFVSEGNLVKQNVPMQGGIGIGIQDTRTFEGWRHEPKQTS